MSFWPMWHQQTIASGAAKLSAENWRRVSLVANEGTRLRKVQSHADPKQADRSGATLIRKAAIIVRPGS